MEYLIKPWEHQLQAIGMADHVRDLALFFEMGTGKTGTTINILRHRYAGQRRLMRTLVLGPVIVVKNWQNEFKMHSKIAPHDVVALTGSGAKRCKTFQDFAHDPGTGTLTRGRIFVTNYEAMEMDKLHALIQDWQPEILVCDESHRLKNPNSVRAKKVMQLADRCKHRYLLTGTPILNSALDIFMQYRILDSGETFSWVDHATRQPRPMNFFEFRGCYFEDRNSGMRGKLNYFPKWEPRKDTYEQLNSMIYRKALRVLKKDCLDLPPLIRQVERVELGKEQRRLYDEMRTEYITWVKEHESSPEPRAVVAQMALVKALRLQQIASGYAKTEVGTEVKIKDNPRLTRLSELLEELTPNHKVIVWATFHENYRQIAAVCKKLGIRYVELHGGISHTERSKGVDAFRTEGDCRVVIGNQGAAGIGINLVEASYSIFYSRNFSLEHDLQAEARNYRGGSEIHSRVTRLDLVAPDTIDELIAEALATKQNIAEQVLAWKV